VVTIASSADLGEAARIMDEKDIGALLVVDNEQLVGIITERDFFKSISK
jgi:CBS domain-containing protein